MNAEDEIPLSELLKPLSAKVQPKSAMKAMNGSTLSQSRASQYRDRSTVASIQKNARLKKAMKEKNE